MKRQYDYTVGGFGDPGAILARQWENAHIFERWGDDNIVYFSDPVDQTLLGSGAGGTLAFEGSHADSPILKVAVHQSATTFLCEESDNVKRTLLLEPGASVKVFVDAWEHYQTVPLVVQVAKGHVGGQVSYQWSFSNYLPIGSPDKISGSGGALYYSDINLAPPIIKTLGHTNRTPTGEYPVSEATKQKTCYCAPERPSFSITNTSTPVSSLSPESGNLLVVIKVAH
jgi:hypothetical protein